MSQTMGTLIELRGTNAVSVNSDWSYNPNVHSYAYAPSIIHDGSFYHMYFCSTPAPVESPRGFDYIRHAASRDGYTWSTPSVILRPAYIPNGDLTSANTQSEDCACDPSVIKVGEWWYMYYGGNIDYYAGVIYVARSNSPYGPFSKWTKRRTWEPDPLDPAPIIFPKVANAPSWADPTKIYYYGAGQPSVIYRDGKFKMWYTDASLGTVSLTSGATEWRRMYSESTNGTDFTQGNEISIYSNNTWLKFNFPGDMGEVKYDSKTNQYIMFDLEYGWKSNPVEVVQYTSNDGLFWLKTIDATHPKFTLELFSNNIGISSDPSGTLRSVGYIIGYGYHWDGAPGNVWRTNINGYSVGINKESTTKNLDFLRIMQSP